MLAACPAGADTVVLANGDRISGTVEHRSATTLTLATAYAGKVRIARDQIATLQADQVPAESGTGVSYTGRVTLSAAQVRGNSSSSRMHGEGEFKARAKHYRYALGLKGTQARESGVEVASSSLATGNYDRYLASDRFFYGRASLERDRFRGIDQRSAIGGGYGLQLRDTETTQLTVRAGLDLVSLERTGGASDTHPALGWGLRFAHWPWQRRVELFHEQDGFWDLHNTRRVTVRSKTGLRVPIAQGLSASAQLNLDWERAPTPGRKSTDSTILLGLGYEW